MTKSYLTYYRFLFRRPWRMFFFFVLAVALSVAQGIQPYFYKLFVDQIVAGVTARIWWLLGAFIFIKILDVTINILVDTFGDWIMLPASVDARVAVFKKIQELDFAYHQSKSTGSLISAIKRGDNAFFDLFHAIHLHLLNVILGLGVMLIVLTRVNWQVSLIILASFFLNILVAIFLIKYNIKTRSDFNQAEDDISDIIVDNLTNFETVKLFAKEDVELSRLQSKFTDWLKKLWAYATSFRLIDIAVGSISIVGSFLVIVTSLHLTAGEFVMIFGMISNFYPRFYELISGFRSIAKSNTDIDKYFSILDQTTKVVDPVRPIKKESVAGNIEFRDVSFTYPEGKKGAVHHINLSIREGQSIALVGHSGVGKTTLVKLLMRFFDPTKGKIMIDGVDIRRFRKNQLRSFMGVVPQDPILFNNTIEFNIAYGADTPSHEQVIAAAKMANLSEFIDNLPLGYQTKVGERGVKLSGGQKQRLAIARMILSNPDIIIFDEATSQLDSESEKQIQDAFWKAAKNKTTIIIAHRLSTVTKAEKIIVMRYGQIVETGTHAALLKRDRVYAGFWKLQQNQS